MATKAQKTYAELRAEIDRLTQEAEQLMAQEKAEVVSRIKEAIDTYHITAADLGLTGGAGGVKKKAGFSKPAAVKYRDGNGNTWVGRGPRPRWLLEALKSGKTLDDFAV